MTDARPGISPMPPEAAAIGQAVVDRLKPLLDDAFLRIDALPGLPAERENDALSALAHVGSFVLLQLIGRLMERKRIDVPVALTIASQSVADRVNLELALLFGAGTRQ